MNYPGSVVQASQYIREKVGKIQEGTVALVLGSGLGGATGFFEEKIKINYEDIPNFPRSTVKGHAGALILGEVAGRPVLAQSGRFHLYEGYDAREATFAIRVFGELGLKSVILTNAAGALDPRFEAGELMLIEDHINMTGHNPLRGDNFEDWGERFPDMSAAYCPALRQLARDKALAEKVGLNKGVYVQVMGPSLETPAETRAFRILGADAIGMSTAIEAIAAHHMGMKVLGVSCLTNKNLPDCMAETSHDEILAVADKATASMARLLSAVIRDIPVE